MRNTAPPAPTGTPDRIRHYIDGEFVHSLGGELFDVLEPTTNTVYVQASAGQPADVDRAVVAARRAFTDGPWARMPNRQRARVLHAVADAVERQDGALAAMESFDTGLPINPGPGAGPQGRRELPVLRRPGGRAV